MFDILEAHGFEVCLVNAQHVKKVPGRKSDVLDCQWLQYRHSVGLLRASFRPPSQICALRALLRHRQNLVRYAGAHVQHIQKSLDQMNLQLHHVLSDITGVSGLRILDAILDGERDPLCLARLRDYRVRSSEEAIAKALTGNYRDEHVFTLRQALEAYRHYQRMIVACDQQIESLFEELSDKIDPQQQPLPRRKRGRSGNSAHFDLRTHCYRVLGTDLTAVPGVDALTAQTVIAEVGPAAAVTSTAHKLARIIYHLVTTGEGYDETVFARQQQRYR